MNNPLFQAICRTGIFMICAQAIVQFRPNESYEKYLKLLVSVMILVQLFLPIGRLFAGSGRMEVDVMLASFRESLERGMEEARRQAEETDVLLQQMTLEEVRRRMEEQGAASEKEADRKESVEEEGEEAVSGRGDGPGDIGDKLSDAGDGPSDAGDKFSDAGDELSGAGDEAAGGRVTVEVEPIAPILGE